MKIKLNLSLLNYPKGYILKIEDEAGVPVSKYWRRRLRDSKFDNCIEIVSEIKKVEEPKVISKIMDGPKEIEESKVEIFKKVNNNKGFSKKKVRRIKK